MKSDPITVGMTIFNVMIGGGPFFVPPLFLLAGIGLSTIWTLLVILMSWVTSEYIVESTAILNALKNYRE
jgi:amino acid permease